MNGIDLSRPVIWHVVFHPGPCIYGRFMHVGLAGYWDDTWLHLDLHRLGVHVNMIHRHDEVQDYLATLLGNYTVVRFGPARDRPGGFFRPLTCVSFVKQTLGIRCGALRPDGLLRDLLRDFNAEMLNASEDAGPNSGSTGSAEAG
ncbi:MAG: hypothetical protein JXQ91_07680 [Vannielia sp.]|uniref:hypothetical protein n=1 Tax=Vannielia sp. TaxID=2813045 RepID=UPI003B8D39B7